MKGHARRRAGPVQFATVLQVERTGPAHGATAKRRQGIPQAHGPAMPYSREP
jgi:hypothetical protein